MCFNCGCGLPNDAMGKGKVSENGGSLTDDDFAVMAKKWNMSIEDTKRNTFNLLKVEFDKQNND